LFNNPAALFPRIVIELNLVLIFDFRLPRFVFGLFLVVVRVQVNDASGVDDDFLSGDVFVLEVVFADVLKKCSPS
jgi:hypothetical protein